MNHILEIGDLKEMTCLKPNAFDYQREECLRLTFSENDPYTQNKVFRKSRLRASFRYNESLNKKIRNLESKYKKPEPNRPYFGWIVPEIE